MSRRSFFWFSTKWLYYKVWPAWIWQLARGLGMLVIALLVAWTLTYVYFYFFPSPTISQIRAETQAQMDSLREFQAKLALLKQEKTRLDSMEAVLYRELTSIPHRETDSVPVSSGVAFSEVLREDTLAHYMERIRGLLSRHMQQEALLQRLSRQIAYLPRHLPIEKGEIAVGFGLTYHPITMQVYEHKGVDFITRPGATISVTADGVVQEVSPYPFGENGYKVLVEHTPTFHTLYYPVDPTVRPGQILSRGTRIGYVVRLSTARTAFLHYEVWRQGQSVDPLPYLWGQLSPDEINALQKAFQSPGHGLH